VALCVLGLKVGAMLLGVNLTNLQFGYISLLCISAVTMAITVLLEPYIALVVAALLSLMSTLILGNELRYCLMTYVVSLVAALSVSAIKSRGDVIRAGYTLVLTNLVLTFLIGQVAGDSWQAIESGSLWSIVTGVFSVALFWLGVGLFERPFGTTTHLGLLELSDPNRPLLQEFSRACPGTYAHSLSVGCLASAAAEEIGADALLCRVSAYYHDIGKMRRAAFFVENQSGDNVHERLNPSLSALIVTAHVKEGLQIADEAKLPPAIRDIILQHHGTSLIRYFYHRASEGIGPGNCGGAFEQQFRYPGPKPQTVEAAIMMLADTVEAASRVLERPTPQRVQEFVQKMIDDKLADGQLDEAPITLKDLASIKAAFVRVLCGMLHSRIEYPGGQMILSIGDDDEPLPSFGVSSRPSFAKSPRARSLRTKLRRSSGKRPEDEPTVTSGNGTGESRESVLIASFGSDPASHAPGP
jgi:putative nucleotidyltransferase with HDIG domain